MFLLRWSAGCAGPASARRWRTRRWRRDNPPGRGLALPGAVLQLHALGHHAQQLDSHRVDALIQVKDGGAAAETVPPHPVDDQPQIPLDVSRRRSSGRPRSVRPAVPRDRASGPAWPVTDDPGGLKGGPHAGGGVQNDEVEVAAHQCDQPGQRCGADDTALVGGADHREPRGTAGSARWPCRRRTGRRGRPQCRTRSFRTRRR